MDLKELVSRLEALTLTKDDFHHRQHLEVAFWYLQSKGSKAGSNAIARMIEVLQHISVTRLSSTLPSRFAGFA